MAEILTKLIDPFGERLKTLRKNRGMSQEALAQAIHISPRNISQYESGQSKPRANTLRKIAAALECDEHWLITGETRECRDYISDLASSYYKNVIRSNQSLYIYEWNDLNRAKYLVNKKEERGQFIQYIAPMNCCLAVRLPKDLNIFNSDVYKVFEQILIINISCFNLKDLKDGTQVIYRTRGEDNLPCLGMVKRDIGQESFFITSLPNQLKSIEFDDIQYEILGIIDGIICKSE